MHLPYILLGVVFLAVAHAAIVPLDVATDQPAEPQPSQEGQNEEVVRSKRGLLLAKAALVGGGILGAKAAIGAGLLGAGIYKAKSYHGYGGWGGGHGGYGGHGGWGGGHGGYGGHGGWGGYGGHVTTYHHYPSYHSSGWNSGPSYHGGYYSSW